MTSFAAAAATPPVHIPWLGAGAAVGGVLLIVLLFRATRRPHIHIHHHPLPAPAPARRRGGVRGKLIGFVVLAGAVLGGYEYLKPKGAAPATAQAAPAPAPSPARSVPTPAPKIITHIIQTHPVLTGTEWLILAGICAVLVLGALSLRNLRSDS